MKIALILNAINPTIGGVLIRGERGTAKSTAVRSLATLLPEMDIVTGCPYGCNPNDPDTMCADCRTKHEAGTITSSKRKMRVVELPVSSTEDKVVGTLDIGEAIKSGEKRFDPGVLAEANRNILYVDEVNLLNDHIVDVLLDAAAMGLNTVEREGISFSHPANFILIGTMNPEEGDLRPQLLDRFGLCVSIEGIDNPDVRLDIVKRKMEFDKNPDAFRKIFATDDDELRRRIVEAKALLPDVRISDDMLRRIVEICIEAGVDGHRGDIAMMKVSSTLAAYRGRTEVKLEDLRDTADMVLLHRMKKTPFSEMRLDREKLDSLLS
ncbi:ATP-binding protein [Candidatus Methanarcanum hacksteinii]